MLLNSRLPIQSFQCIVLFSVLGTYATGQTGTGVITTLAGTTSTDSAPARGYSGDNGPGTNALLAPADVKNACDSRQPTYEQTVHLVVDSGNVYFTDSANQRIRKISAQGIISTIAGTGDKPAVGAPPACENTSGASGIGDGGPALAARLYYPGDIAVAPNGNIIIVDQQDNRLRQINSSGQISTIIGSGLHNLYVPSAPPTVSPLDWPSAIAIDSNGVIYFAELHSSRVAKLANGVLVTVAGAGIPGFSGDGGKATSARLSSNVTGIALDANNNLYIADELNHRVRKVTPDGVINTIAGNGTAGFSGDGGPASDAMLNMPADVKVDKQGNVYIADMLNHRIRRIDASGKITTVAGDGRQGRGPDNVPAAASSLNTPASVALDSVGDLYIADWQNFLIRKVSFSNRPLITPGAIVNAASFAPAPIPVAPGSIVSLFGVNLAADTVGASSVPLPTSLAGVSVRINGTPAPLFFVSPNQINAQVPYETSLGQAAVTVTTGTGTSTAETLNVAPSAVGIFQYSGTTRAVVLNQDGTPNGPENPESRGRVLVVYLTGQGAVDPPVPTGQAAPTDSLSYVRAPSSSSVGGADATVLFLGLAPTFVGVTQANIQIPSGAPVGSSVSLVISVAGQGSNTTTVSIK